MPTQVDGVGVHANVHEVVHNLTLDVVLHPVHKESLAHIHHFDKRQVPADAIDRMWMTV